MATKQIPPSLIDGKTYFADEEGNILNAQGRKRKPDFSPSRHHHKGGSHYPVVKIADKDRVIHVLVCSAFWGVRPPEHVCHHLDGNKFNNRPDNLIWVSKEDHPKYDRMVRAGRILTHVQADKIMLSEMSKHCEL